MCRIDLTDKTSAVSGFRGVATPGERPVDNTQSPQMTVLSALPVIAIRSRR